MEVYVHSLNQPPPVNEYVQNTKVGVKKVNVSGYEGGLGNIEKNVTEGETFEAFNNYLSHISIKFGTFARVNDANLYFILKSSVNSKKILREDVINEADLNNFEYYTFSFKPIKDSLDKNFYFYLYSPKSNSNNAVTVIVTNSFSPNSASRLYVDNEELNNNIVFKAYYSPPYSYDNTILPFKVITNRISQYKPPFMKDFPVLFIFGLYFLLGFIFIFYMTFMFIRNFTSRQVIISALIIIFIFILMYLYIHANIPPINYNLTESGVKNL
jgi:hypothetical protein